MGVDYKMRMSSNNNIRCDSGEDEAPARTMQEYMGARKQRQRMTEDQLKAKVLAMAEMTKSFDGGMLPGI